MDKKIDFKELTEHILDSYLAASTEEEMDILELLDENMSVVGTGKHEIFHNFQEFYQNLQFEAWQREEVRFEWKDFSMEEIAIDDDHHMVYGSVLIQGHLKNGYTCIDMDTRFTILYAYKDGKWRVLHIHHSVPDKEQMNDEEFPNTLGKQVEETREALIAAKDDAKRAKNANDELTRATEELKLEKEKLEKALEDAEIKNEIISAIGKSYFYISRIDLEEDCYEVVSGYEKFPKDVNRKGSLSKSVKDNSNLLVEDAYIESFLEFVDITTMAERLEKEDSLGMEYRMKNGMWHKARLIVKKKDENGHVTHVLLAIREITEEKRKEQQILMKAAEAKHEVIEKNRFLSNMSHDIRTPVNGIVGLLDIADQFPEDLNLQKKCRDKIKDLSGYLVTMLGNILELNQLQSDRSMPQETVIDITELLRTVNEESQQDAAKKNIRYAIDWDRSQIHQRYVLGDPMYVQRIIKIVADNAIKFSPSGSVISVWCKDEKIDEDHVSISFGCEDHGVGMSKEFLDHAFDLFVQEDEGSRTKYQGIGIGLSIAKTIADKLHGTISIESEKGVGTKVVTRIPFKTADFKEAGRVEDCVPLSLKGLRALVVEDNELNMEIAKFILEDQGVMVECAWDGKEALDMFEDSVFGYYNLILMDIMMPNLNGREATRKIRALNRQDAKTIPIISMSANVFQDDIIKNQLAGMDGHLPKPLDGQTLIEVVKQCLIKKRV